MKPWGRLRLSDRISSLTIQIPVTLEMFPVKLLFRNVASL
jgi:hypothetical protein